MRRDMENLQEWTDAELNETWEALSTEVGNRRRSGQEMGAVGILFEKVAGEYTRRHPIDGFQVSYRR